MTQSKNLAELVISVQQLRSAERYEETIELVNIGYEMALLEEDLESATIMLKNQMLSYLFIGSYREAFVCLNRFEELCSNHPTKLNYLNYYTLIGIVFAILNSNMEAKEFLLKARKLAIELEYHKELIHVYSNLCTVCLEMDELDEAVKYGMAALALCEKVPPTNTNLVPVKTNAIESLAKVHRLNEAKIIYQEVFEMIEQSGLERDKALLSSVSAWISYSEGDFHKAIEQTECASETFKKIGDRYMVKSMTRNLIQFYKEIDAKDLVIEMQSNYIYYMEENEQQGYRKAISNIAWQNKLKKMKLEIYLDPLTKIHNRRYLEEKSEQWLSTSKNSNAQFGCIIIDIDNFKQFNDQYGHLVGDDVIKQVALITNDYFQQHKAIFARFGGDEFVALLKLTSRQSLEEIMKEITAKFETIKLPYNKQMLSISISCGGAYIVNSEDNAFSKILKMADDALYNIKQNGRNAYCILG